MNREDSTKDIPAAVRKQVLARDNYRCRRCGREDNLSLHHIIPRSQGGRHIAENLVTVCILPCHALLEDHRITVRYIKGHFYFSKL